MALGVPREYWGSLHASDSPASPGDPSQCYHPSWFWGHRALLEVPTQCWSPWLVLGVLSQHLWSPVSPGRPPDVIEVPAGIRVQLMFMPWMIFGFPSQHWGPRSHFGGTRWY